MSTVLVYQDPGRERLLVALALRATVAILVAPEQEGRRKYAALGGYYR